MDFLEDWLCFDQLGWENLKRAPQFLKRKVKVGSFTFDEDFDNLSKDLGLLETNLKSMIKYCESFGNEYSKLTDISGNIGEVLDKLLDPYNCFSPSMRDKLKSKSIGEIWELFNSNQDQQQFIDECKYWNITKEYVHEITYIGTEVSKAFANSKVLIGKSHQCLEIIEGIKANIKKRNTALDSYDTAYDTWDSLVIKSKSKDLSVKETQQKYCLERKLEGLKANYDTINELFKTELPIFFKLIDSLFRPMMVIMYFTQLTASYQVITRISGFQENLDFDLNDINKYDWNENHINQCQEIFHLAEQEIDDLNISKFRDKYYQNLLDRVSKPYVPNLSDIPELSTPEDSSPENHEPVVRTIPKSNTHRLSPIPETTQAKVLYDYTAQIPEDLTIKAGDIIEILDQKGNWWRARYKQQTGQIPYNFVQLL